MRTEPKRVRYEVQFISKDDSRYSVTIPVDAETREEAIEFARHDAPEDWVCLRVAPIGEQLFKSP